VLACASGATVAFTGPAYARPPTHMTDCGLTADGGQRIYVTGVTCKKARPLAEKLEATGKCTSPYKPAASIIGCLTFRGVKAYVLWPVTADGWQLVMPWLCAETRAQGAPC
jgi:hypothetical protein